MFTDKHLNSLRNHGGLLGGGPKPGPNSARREAFQAEGTMCGRPEEDRGLGEMMEAGGWNMSWVRGGAGERQLSGDESAKAETEGPGFLLHFGTCLGLPPSNPPPTSALAGGQGKGSPHTASASCAPGGIQPAEQVLVQTPPPAPCHTVLPS